MRLSVVTNTCQQIRYVFNEKTANLLVGCKILCKYVHVRIMCKRQLEASIFPPFTGLEWLVESISCPLRQQAVFLNGSEGMMGGEASGLGSIMGRTRMRRSVTGWHYKVFTKGV